MNKEKKLPEIPKSLQGILWSVNVARLDLERDKNYIIHQVLAYGNLEQIRWLFQVYGRQGVKDVFMKDMLSTFKKYFLDNPLSGSLCTFFN